MNARSVSECRECFTPYQDYYAAMDCCSIIKPAELSTQDIKAGAVVSSSGRKRVPYSAYQCSVCFATSNDKETMEECCSDQF